MSFLPKNYVTEGTTQKHAELISNRVKKRYAHLRKRFKKQNIDCFRLYDWDIPEVRAVVDWYAGHLVVAEYERLQTGPNWLPQIAEAVGQALNVPKDQIHIKRRRTSTMDEPRYKKLDSTGQLIEVQERDLKFYVNLTDYLDTGLFSDHRDTRELIRKEAKEKSFLNLFAYTGVFTCSAAAGGAASTLTVDRSEDYIHWAHKNMEVNGLSSTKHQFVQSDCGKLLGELIQKNRRFDLAFVDPPSFFRNRSRKHPFDINEDHPELLEQVFQVMNKEGTVYFSTNHQRFQPDFEGLKFTNITELTPKTIPEDYRNRTVHRCWRITV